MFFEEILQVSDYKIKNLLNAVNTCFVNVLWTVVKYGNVTLGLDLIASARKKEKETQFWKKQPAW